MNKLTMSKISAGIVCAAAITAAFPGCAQKTESASSSSSVNDSSSVSDVITESSEPESVPDVEAEDQTEDIAAVEETDEVKAFLSDIAGTYIGLFEPVTFKDEYSSLWHDYCAAIVGEDTADTWADMMKYSIGGKLHGSEAVEAYSVNPEQTQFCCKYIKNDRRRNSTVVCSNSNLFDIWGLYVYK